MLKGIKHIVVMGCAAENDGNKSKCAEFNFICDPEAAQIVFSTFPQDRITLISWTLTKAFLFSSPKDLELYQKNKENTTLGEFTKQTWQPVIDFSNGEMQMADPLASFVVCYPEGIIEAEKLRINIALSGEKVGISETSKDEKNEGATNIVKKIDFDKYKEIFTNLIRHQ